VNGHGPAPAAQPNGTDVTSTDDQDSSQDAPSHGWGGQNRQEYRRPPVAPRGGYFHLNRGRGSSRGLRGGFRGGAGRGGYAAAAPLPS